MNNPRRAVAVPVEQGRPEKAVKCEKKGHHLYAPARMIIDPVDGSRKVTTADHGTATHRVCLRCGLCKPK